MRSLREQQEYNERKYSRKFIDQYISEEIRENSQIKAKVNQGVRLLKKWLEGSYHESKQARLNQIKSLDLEQLVSSIFVATVYCQIPETLVNVSAQLAGMLRFTYKSDGVQTAAELLAVLCETDVFDINQGEKGTSLLVKSNIQISDELIDYIRGSSYLPPMICKPNKVTSNYQSGYLTHNDSLIINGKGNHKICLDIINIQNGTRLRLDTEFLSKIEEESPSDLESINKENMKSKAQIRLEIEMKKEQWKNFKEQSYKFYELMVKQGNSFYLTHKVDKRGRMYSQGYHINTQGYSFKKAMIELYKEEIIEGVPNDVRIHDN